MNIPIGTRIELMRDVKCDLSKGMKGTIKDTKNKENLGVSFDNWNTGHDLNGAITNSSGWYIDRTAFQIINETNCVNCDRKITTIIYKKNDGCCNNCMKFVGSISYDVES